MNSASIGDIGFNETYIESMVLNFTIVNSQDFPSIFLFVQPERSKCPMSKNTFVQLVDGK